MVEKNTTYTEFLEAPPHVSEWRRFTRVFFQRKLVIFGLAILVLLVITAVFATWLAPYDPYKLGTADSLLQPSMGHPLGTDILGRDTHLRLKDGADGRLYICRGCFHNRHYVGVNCRVFRWRC